VTYGPSTLNRRRRTNAELSAIDEAIVEAVRDEHPVSLRGVYYRVVSAGAVEKTENGYRLVGRQLLKLRRANVVPYTWITDGTRWVIRPDSWSDVDQMLKDAAASYRKALWHDQDVLVHVFVEKDAISGVVSPVTDRWDVPLGVLRGYASESFAYSMAQEILAADKTVYVYQLGDHDPSGVDAWRDFTEKVTGFLGPSGVYYDDDGLEGVLTTTTWSAVFFDRLAVTEDQIEDYQLPTRPTNRTDSRSAGFLGESVEVDAIRPSVLRELVENAIAQHIDAERLRITRMVEQSERELLLRIRGGR
jgi:hypothetical protein